MKADKVFYDKKIAYLDYYERGEKIKNGGFVKWEAKGDTSRVQVHIRGLYATDTLQGEIRILSAGESYVADNLLLNYGTGDYASIWKNDNLAETGIAYVECDGIIIRLSENRYLKGQWRESIKKPLPSSQEETVISREDIAPKEAFSEEDAEPAVTESLPKGGADSAVTEALPRGGADTAVTEAISGEETDTADRESIALEETKTVVREVLEEGETNPAFREALAEGETNPSDKEVLAEKDKNPAVREVLAEKDKNPAVREVLAERDTNPAVGEAFSGKETESASKEDFPRENADSVVMGVLSEKPVSSADLEILPVEEALFVKETESVIAKAFPDEKEEPAVAVTASAKAVSKSMPKEQTMLSSDKWEQLNKQYPRIHPFGDAREYLSITPRDFVILSRKYQNLVQNSFLLHGYYNYGHVILTRLKERDEECFYLGVPGVYFDREKQAALMFGFEGFEAGCEQISEGGFGYYMKRVEI